MEDEGFLSQETMKALCGCICAVACITGIVLLVLGFSSLEATEYGLDYSWLSKTISPQIYANGLYFIGIGHSFIKFPRNVQTVEFSKERTASRPAVESRTADGLEVTIEVSFQYVLQHEHLFLLFNKYGTKYKDVIQNVAINILTEEATGYNAYDFFMNREKIKNDFLDMLNKELNVTTYSTVQFLQLRSVDLPMKFEQAIQDSEVKKQDIQKAQAELSKMHVETDTLIKSAFIRKNVTINIAEGEASAILKQNEADVASLTKYQDSQTEAYSKFKTRLTLENKELLTFIKTKLIDNFKGDHLTINLDSPEKP